MKRILLIAITVVAAFWGVSTLADLPGNSSKVYIDFKANGGTGSMSKQSARRYSAVTLKANKFRRAGYIFVGWRDELFDEFFTDKARIDNVYFGRTLVAQWVKDEYGWLDSAHVFAGTLDNDGNAPGTIILKTGKRNARTKISKFSASVVWPGTTKKITMKGSSSDGFAVLTGGGKTLYVEADDVSASCWRHDGMEDFLHIAGKEGAACWIRGVFQPETYSCVSFPTMSSNSARWTVPRNAAGLKLSFKKNTLEFTGSYTDKCDGRKVRMKVAGVAVDVGGYGYAYGGGNIYPFRLKPL